MSHKLAVISQNVRHTALFVFKRFRMYAHLHETDVGQLQIRTWHGENIYISLLETCLLLQYVDIRL